MPAAEKANLIDVSARVADARRWLFAVSALQVAAVAVIGYALSSADETTVNGPLPGANPELVGEILMAFLLAFNVVLPLTWFATRGARIAMLVASLALLPLSVIALLHAGGRPYEALSSSGLPVFDDALGYVHTAIYVANPTVWGIALVVAGAAIAPMLTAALSAGAASFGLVLSLRPVPSMIRAESVGRASRLSQRGIAVFASSVALWIPTIVLAVAAAVSVYQAIAPLADLKHNVIGYVLWLNLRWGPHADKHWMAGAIGGFSSTLAAQSKLALLVLILLLAGLFVVSLAARATWALARRMSQYDALQLRSHDTRLPIFVIRSFKDEQLTVRDSAGWSIALGRLRARAGFEEVLVNALWRFGPVLTIGKPGDRVPPLGAAREYVDDERWRERVREYLEASAAIAIMVGDTSNFSWECERVVAFNLSTRAIAVLPPVSAHELAARWEIFQRHFQPAAGVELPVDRCVHAVVFCQTGPCVIASRDQTRFDYEAAMLSAWELVCG